MEHVLMRVPKASPYEKAFIEAELLIQLYVQTVQ